MSNNKQIDVDFLDFIAEKVKNVKSPMNLSELCREFKKKSAISLSDSQLVHKLRKIRDRISEMEHIDTKVKMMFALGSPVSNGVLIELKKQADVELDEQHRIIKYKKHGAGRQLSGVHTGSGRSCDMEIEKRMMRLLAEKSENSTSPMSDNAFLKEFNSSEGNLKVEKNLKLRYHLLKKQVYLTPDFDQKTKIKMLFVSNAKVHANILDELRQTAVVEVDEYQRITKYESNNGSLKLEGERRKLRQSQGPAIEWSKEEKKKLLNFIAQKSKQAKVPLFIVPLCREYAEKDGFNRTMKSVEHYIHKLLPEIPKLDSFDIETKVMMLFALSVSVDNAFLEELQKKAFVEVDEHHRITKYEANNGKFKLEGEHRKPRTLLEPTINWSKTEKDIIWNYIAEKSKQTNVQLFIKPLCREILEKNKISRTTDSVQNYVRRLLPKIPKLNTVDMETRVKMLFALRVSIDEEFLNELRKKAFVEIDKKRRITKYEAMDGILKLTKDHSMSAQTEAKCANKKSMSGFSDVSEIDEEPEDDENEENEEEDLKEETSILNMRSRILSKKQFSDNHFNSDSDDNSCESSEKVENSKNERKEKITRKYRNTYFSETNDETDDEESEEEESEASSSTRRNQRVSKKRYPDAHFCCDFDNVMFDSPKNVEDSKIEKETEEFVEKSMSSSRTWPLVSNKKRKFMENPSDATSSFSKSRKYGNVANTPNDTESEKNGGGTKKNDAEEVIYDGTVKPLSPVELLIKQEPLSYEEVKLEGQEYKPDLSFLCSTTQKAIQNLSETQETHAHNVDQSTENTEEMTSGKEFMKLLRGLVTTLDSPILVELQSKIEESIEKLGDRDHKIPTEEIVMTLNTGLMILNKSASTIQSPTRESTNLRDFLLILRSTLSTFYSSSLNAFQLKIKETIKKLDSQDKNIPVESIRTVLETVLLLAML